MIHGTYLSNQVNYLFQIFGLIVAKEMLLEQLQWVGPVFEVSAATGAGTDELGHAVMQELERMAEEAVELAAVAEI